MATHDDNTDQLDSEARQRLRTALHAMYDTDIKVPEHVDRLILDGARRQFAIRRRWRWARSAAAATAAAAAIAMVFTFWPGDEHVPVASTARMTNATMPADVDGSGRVDILDAFTLARQLEQTGITPSLKWDINRDGRLDTGDVHAIANAAVRIERG